jgi:hypothetical protein
MSSYEYCPRGGQEGIATTVEQQIELAEVLEEAYRDTFIPLPMVQPEHQRLLTLQPHDHEESTEYWENDRGSHGWCCTKCGKVIQWG